MEQEQVIFVRRIMKLFVSTYHLPKEGHTEKEYEDAALTEVEKGKDIVRFNFAIADGATEGMFSKEWANLLVAEYKSYQKHLDFNGFINNICSYWEQFKVKDIINKRGKPIQWYEEPGLAAGAFASFLGFTLHRGMDKQKGSWEAFAVGDSCLVQVRDEEIFVSFPLTHSSDFNSRPFLISSNNQKNLNISPHIIETGEWKKYDKFFLMTDAIAAWFLKEYENGNKPWKILKSYKSKKEVKEKTKKFKKLIDESRQQKTMRNDDVTVIRIDIM